MDDVSYWVLLLFLTLLLAYALVSALSDLGRDTLTDVRHRDRTVPKAALRTPPLTASVQRIRESSDRGGQCRARSGMDPRVKPRRRR